MFGVGRYRDPFHPLHRDQGVIELRVLESNINSPAQQVLAELTAGTAAHHAPIRACQGQSNAGQMISLTRWLRASKAHDKVFALHGILTKLG
jgi:hypothetical protein